MRSEGNLPFGSIAVIMADRSVRKNKNTKTALNRVKTRNEEDMMSKQLMLKRIEKRNKKSVMKIKNSLKSVKKNKKDKKNGAVWKSEFDGGK